MVTQEQTIRKKRHFKKTMTEKALEANRQNAQKSTGPKSRQIRTYYPNTKHGILASIPVLPAVESQKEWNDFVTGLKNDLHPDGTLENTLVERIAGLLWRIRRLQIYESKTVEKEIANVPIEIASKWRPKLTKNNGNVDVLSSIFSGGQDYEKCDAKQVELEAKIYPKVLETINDLYAGDCKKKINKDIAKEIAKISAELFIEERNKIELTKPKEKQKVYSVNGKYLELDFSNTKELAKVITKDAKECNVSYKKHLERIYSKANDYCIFIIDDWNRMKEAIANKREEILVRSISRQAGSESMLKFESHLHRQYIQTLHELQRLQGMRAGISGPPQAVDITGLEG